jgi:hypothetical protein
VPIFLVQRTYNKRRRKYSYSSLFFFLSKKEREGGGFQNAYSDPKFCWREVVLVIPMPGKKVL